MSTCDIAVVGGGPAGLLCALLLCKNGAKPLLMRKQGGTSPGRTVALMHSSIDLLRQAGVWEILHARAAPLRAIRLIDDTGNLFRAPVVTFEARELGLNEFGYNIANDDLQAALEGAVQSQAIETIDGEVDHIVLHDSHIEMGGKNFSCLSRVVVAADGRHSILRKQAGFESKQNIYPQAAVTALLQHEAPHHGISTEFHTRKGPMTYVPMACNCSSLVLVTSPEDATQLMALDEKEFCFELRRRSQNMLGTFTLAGKRGNWPLELTLPDRFARNRVLLIGEAAHVLPPIGAQGLNLGFRDADVAATIIASALGKKEDPGDAGVLAAYHRSRSQDIRLRSFAVDQFNRSLLTSFLPIHFMRGFGLYMAQKSHFFRRKIMQAGLG